MFGLRNAREMLRQHFVRSHINTVNNHQLSMKELTSLKCDFCTNHLTVQTLMFVNNVHLKIKD